MHHFNTSLSGSPIVRGVYPPINVSDLKKSMQWYGSILRYRVLRNKYRDIARGTSARAETWGSRDVSNNYN